MDKRADQELTFEIEAALAALSGEHQDAIARLLAQAREERSLPVIDWA